MSLSNDAERARHIRNRKKHPTRLVFCLLATLFALSCAGCGSKGNRAGQAAQRPAENVSVPGAVPVPKPPPETQPKKAKAYLEIGFDLMDRESLGPLKRGISPANVLARLGQPEEKSETAVWDADGLVHQTWYYRSLGIELDMANDEPRVDNGIEATDLTVNMITATTPCAYRTLRGVGIGSSRSEVILLYAEEIDPELSQDPDCVIAGSCFGGIIFAFRDGSVSEIFIGAAAE